MPKFKSYLTVIIIVCLLSGFVTLNFDVIFSILFIYQIYLSHTIHFFVLGCH